VASTEVWVLKKCVLKYRVLKCCWVLKYIVTLILFWAILKWLVKLVLKVIVTLILADTEVKRVLKCGDVKC
jgi:hypothetical protein